MTNTLSAIFFAVLATSQVACNASDRSSVAAAPKSAPGVSGPNVSQYIAGRGWTLAKSKSLVLPVSDIAVVLYTAKGDFAPSCGLLAQTPAGTEFFEILGPEKGAGFPQCITINDVVATKLRNREYLVVEYINRDTREDFFRQYFYLYRDGTGRYVVDSELNDSTTWPEPLRARDNKVDVPRAEEGIRRAKGTLFSKAVPGMKFLERDFMAGQTSAFASFHDKANEKCTFAVDTGTKPVVFGHDLFVSGDRCKEVLATSKLEHAGITYYLALFKGVARNQLSAVSVTSDGVVNAENRLVAAAAKDRPLKDMKTAKAAFKAAL